MATPIRVLILPAVLLVLSYGAAGAAEPVSVNSPDGRIQIRISDQGGLSYTVSLGGRTVVEPSPLGIVVDGVNLSQGARTGKSDRYRLNETYAWHGVHSTAVNRCNGARVAAAKTGEAFTVDVRACNDGVAFRFVVPGEAGKERVPDEATAFRLPAGSTVWYHDFEGHYEALHKKKAIEEVPAGDWAAPPLTARLPGDAGYISITEGALFNYSGMGLQADGKLGFAARLGHTHPVSYPFRLRYKDDVERMSKPASVTGTITTPWRIVLVGADLNALVNNDIIHNVAPPPDARLFPKGANTEWLKPGRALWKYLDGGENTFEEMKNFARLAGELGFEYNLLEGFWQKWPMAQLQELVKYSKERGVGTILWKHSRDIRTPADREKFFDLCREAGVAGVKLDFFDHEHKDVVELYEAALRAAAERKLIVNFHGANKPSGESRTWPNELTREGIRGMESRKTNRATHDATLPFTRMLAGHADYTPMVFSERRNDTTWAHQIASAAIFTSPLLVYGAHPRSIVENPAVELIRAIPSVWDETIALPSSEIGEVAAFARRTGRTWFVAVMNGASARSIKVPLSFLGNGEYQGLIVRDDPAEAAALRKETAMLSRNDSLAIEMRPGGGFIARFAPPAAAADPLREKRLQWWREARFGMFIHWGLYAVPAGEWKGKPIRGIGEWIMNRAKIPVGEYEHLAKQFNPVKFNAEEWVRIAKDAGMKYIVITSKHHDGFAMFHSKSSPYNIVDATPFKRDPLKELAAAAQKAGIKLCFYYSHAQDWHDPDAAGNNWDFPDESRKDFAKYFERKVKPQVRELLTGYGPVGLMWYDTPRVITKEQSEELAALTHQLQPMCIVSGRVGHDAGDYMSTGDNQVTVGSRRTDWEAPVTLNDTWGFKKDDHNWKTPQVLVQQLVMTASRGGNYLLNVGPTAEGTIPQPSVERLAAVGKWMKANSESIYATQGNPYPYELNWGLITTKPGRMYLHVFDWPEKELVLYGLQTKVKSAWLLANKRPLKVSQRADRATELNELRITVPPGAPDPIVSVIVLDVEGRPEVSQELMQQPDGSVTLDAFLGEVQKASQPPHLQFDSRGVAERWLNKEESLSWKFRVFRPGEYRVAVLTSEQKYNTNWEGGHTVNVRVAGTGLRGTVERHETVVNPRSPYWNHVLSNIGRVSLQKPGVYDVSLKPESLETAKKLGLTLVSVRLIPVSPK